VNNTNLCGILHCFQVIAASYSNYHFSEGMLCFNSLVLGELLNCGLQNFAPKIRNITIVWCTTFRHIKPFRHNSTMLETDRQMNRNATAIACI